MRNLIGTCKNRLFAYGKENGYFNFHALPFVRCFCGPPHPLRYVQGGEQEHGHQGHQAVGVDDSHLVNKTIGIKDIRLLE